jgi:hypothetical protein
MSISLEPSTMTTPDIRTLCAELIEKIDYTWGDVPEDVLDLMGCARAALAAEPVGATATYEELIQLAIDTRLYRFQATAGDPVQYEMTEQQVHAFALAVLARWGRPTPPAPEPGEVAELAEKLIAESRPVDPELAAVLTTDARWELYEVSSTPRDPHLPPPAVDVDPERDLLNRILGECVNTDLSATHAAGVLYAAAALMLSKTYDLSPCEQEGE